MLGRLVVGAFFREIAIQGRENLPAVGPVLFAPNHPNALLDPLLLERLSPTFQLRFVAKATLFRIPVFGWLLRRAGAIPVVRRLDAAGEVDHTAFFGACLEALAAGDSIVIFPEGRSLPQPSMAPLRTGAARLYLMARERGIDPAIVPVGLNYERGDIFRSAVVMRIAPRIDTAPFVEAAVEHPELAVRGLTAALTAALEAHVFQAASFRDRKLMLLLERLYAAGERDASWPSRLERLKTFEEALERLHQSRPGQIDSLRRQLARYDRLTARAGPRRPGALALAAAGCVLNYLPYKLCAALVRLTRRDESDAATYKILYSLLLFPATYILEGWLAYRWLGLAAAAVFAAVILPLTWLALWFFDRGEDEERSSPRRSPPALARLRDRITAQVDELAGDL